MTVRERPGPGALDAYNGAEFMASPSGTNSNVECPLLLAQQRDGADDAAPEDENEQTVQAKLQVANTDPMTITLLCLSRLISDIPVLMHACFPGTRDVWPGRQLYSSTRANSRQSLSVSMEMIAVLALADLASQAIRLKSGEWFGRMAPHVWFLTATALYNRAFDMCGYPAILYSMIRRAGTILVGSDDGDVDWFHGYKQLATIAELPNRPPYKLLQPKAFVSLFRLGHLASRDAYWALPVIE
ncbi:hypothetical protein CNMCM8927_004990 [Aspergillus lentulus]|uniref:Uncharacterized protein n=1 Tax=Aspergillus lentulus TaxID=293939 RepID=A0AAN6BU84_ASPLE|nr:hypothetical protein CNMCM8060_003339 [Aspergillus lentulus]KAF4197552.1 hypothetical protein CNMCM8694_002454 [Aspergillus lentulus]KAF4209787.1 hypothetical protein CNMCM8927_004990 [Aspergillus lentulus]